MSLGAGLPATILLLALLGAPDWLAVVPEGWEAAVAPLAAHRREAGLAVEVLPFPPGLSAEDLRARVRARSPARFLVLVGDADLLPPFVVDGAGTDLPYADRDDDGSPDLVVGRITADTPAALEAYAGRITATERHPPPGTWRRTLAFAAGPGGFGPLVDAALETIFGRIVEEAIPPRFDTWIAYGVPTSPYFLPPPDLSRLALARAGEGTLALTYVGHGFRDGFDSVPWEGRPCPILSAEDLVGLDAGGRLPLVVAIACLTGKFDDPEADCVGERTLAAPGGPATFIGASAVSQPYANCVLGLALTRSLCGGNTRITAGEALLAARRDLLAHPEDPLAAWIDGLAGGLLAPEERRRQREENARIYNLLGDPAVPIATPQAGVTLQAAPWEGRRLLVEGTVEGSVSGTATVTLEVPRGRIRRLRPAAGAEAILQNHGRANDKVISRAEVAIEGGRFRADLEALKKMPPGPVWVKAWVEGGGGCAFGAVVAPPPPTAQPEPEDGD